MIAESSRIRTYLTDGVGSGVVADGEKLESGLSLQIRSCPEFPSSASKDLS